MEGRISAREELFEAWRARVGFVLGPVLFGLLLVFPIPGLTPEAARLAAVLALAGVFWLTEPIPIPATALLAVALCVVCQVADAKGALVGYSDPTIFLFLGSFLLAEAMRVHGLDRRIALTLLSFRFIGNSTMGILVAMGLVAAFLSMWLSNTATTAMLVPVALGIVREVEALLGRGSADGQPVAAHRYAPALILAVAFGASVGGVGTPIGTPPNLIGVGLIEKATGHRISFLEWMQVGVPLVMVLMGLLLLLLRVMLPPEVRTLDGLGEFLRARREELGPVRRGELNTLAAFLVAVGLWTFPAVLSLAALAAPAVVGEGALKAYSKLLPEGIAALLAATLLFLLPVDASKRLPTLTWKQATGIDWGTILLFGAGISLGSLMFSTGLAEALGRATLAATGLTGKAGITLVAVALGVAISEATSNTASANMIVPLALSMAAAAGIDPMAPALGACFGASFGFMLPVSTPPNAIAYGTGRVPLLVMLRTGLVFDLLGIAVIWGALMLLV